MTRDAVKRLKQRLARILHDPLRYARLTATFGANVLRRDVNQVVDEWAAAEGKRKARKR